MSTAEPVTSESLTALVVSADASTFGLATRQKVADTFTDSVGIAFQAAGRNVTRTVRDFALTQLKEGASVVIGTATRLSPTGAALCNGQAIHSLEMDDIARPSYSHPSCHLVAAVLAIAYIAPVSVAEFVNAFAVGFEVEAALSVATGGFGHVEHGWHPTATLGAIGAAAAGARMLGLDAARVRNALGIAASMAGGLRTAFGTDVKPLHAGLAAQSGVAAALLARDGLRASNDAIEGEGGFLQAFGGATAKARIDHIEDGESRYLEKRGALSLKPYPACGGTHAAIETGIIAHERGIDPERIESIDIAVSTRARDVLRYDAPHSPQERQFSLQFTTASAIVNGRFDQRSLDETPAPIVEDLTRRSRWVSDDRVEGSVHFGCVLTVNLRGGGHETVIVRVPLGREDRWPTTDFLRERFLSGLAEAGVARADGLALYGGLSRISQSDESADALLESMARISASATNQEETAHDN